MPLDHTELLYIDLAKHGEAKHIQWATSYLPKLETYNAIYYIAFVNNNTAAIDWMNRNEIFMDSDAFFDSIAEQLSLYTLRTTPQVAWILEQCQFRRVEHYNTPMDTN